MTSRRPPPPYSSSAVDLSRPSDTHSPTSAAARRPFFPTYTTLAARDSPRSKVWTYWDESVGHGGRRLAATLRRQWRAPCRKSTTETVGLSRLCTAATSTCTYYRRHVGTCQREVLCGVAAMLLMMPETVAFSYAANVDPVHGLYATGLLGLTVSLLGGVPATVAGAAGAIAMVLPAITSSSGALGHLTPDERREHLFVAVTLAGVLELGFGLAGLSTLFAMIPRTAHIGFLNGLAVMMFLSQKTTIQTCAHDDGSSFGACEVAGDLKWMAAASPTTWVTIGLVLLTMAIMHYFPKVPYLGPRVPPTLVAAVVGVGFEFGLNRPLLGYDVRTIGDTSPLSGGLPPFALPAFQDVQDWGVVLSTAASVMAVGLFESLMTLQSVVDLKKEQLSQKATRKECIAQGIGNILCGFFSGMGGCSMIAQSNGNVLNGGRYRLSAFVGGVSTFLVVLFASSVIEHVPVACLTGILFVIVIHTFYWPSLMLIFRAKIEDTIAIVLVTVLAAATNLAIAVIAGVIWQCLVNSWQSGRKLAFHTDTEVVSVVSTCIDSELRTHQEVAKLYYVTGPFLFSSVASFREFFDVLHDPNVVIVDMRNSTLGDFSAVAALREAAVRYRDAGKTLVARNLDAQSLDLLDHDVGWASVDCIQVATPGAVAAGDELAKSTTDKERASQTSLHQLHTPLPGESTAAYGPAGP
ncbi:unnamed protein product [Hyaloperonospora brassicae]|uniref:STAS domain-containing protein n=1 Tax=Hyaloperonospora brassicae TaxID=162125 RepID=A0AAV0V0W4_HYABA|nr:unnamed protein product [Hyaloperonospora brassicae]